MALLYGNAIRNHRRLGMSVIGLLGALAVGGWSPAWSNPRTVPITNPKIQTGSLADVELLHPVIGSEGVTALVRGLSVYLRPRDVLDFIHVHDSASQDGRKLYGFFIDENRRFVIDNAARSITIAGHQLQFDSTEFVNFAGETYVDTLVLARAFSLKCNFDPRRLEVVLASKEKLPAELEASDAELRQHAPGLRSLGGFTPDHTFELTRSLFSLGTLDWSLGSAYRQPELVAQYDFRIGSQFAGGDLDADLAGAARQRIDWNAVPWRWRFPIEATPAISSVMLGRRASFSNMQLSDSMVGIQVTNARPIGFDPNQMTYTNYTIADRTEPDWTVELYINELLVSFVKADHNGYYRFVIPIPYGSTDVRLRFVGPYGEVRSKDISFRIPFTFLRPGTVEYTATAGFSAHAPALANSIAKLDTRVGINESITLDAGTRYYHDIHGRGAIMPFASSSIRLSRDVLFSGNYFYDAGYQTSLSISTLGGLWLQAEYDAGLHSNVVSLDDMILQSERSLKLGAPLPWQLGSVQANATDLPSDGKHSYVQLSGIANVTAHGLSVSLSANANMFREAFKLRPSSHVLGGITITPPSVSGFSLSPLANGDLTSGQIFEAGISVSKYFAHVGSLSVSAIHDFAGHSNYVQAGFGFGLSFAQVGIAAGASSGSPATASTTEQGSLLFDPNTGRFLAVNRPEVRSGGIAIEPFLDRNNDGKREDGEPLIQHVDLDQVAGTVLKDGNGTLRVLDLEPYVSYDLKTNMKDVENSSLLPKFQTFSVTPPANGFRLIRMPILTVGQIEGYVMRTTLNGPKAEGGIRIKIQHADANDTSMVVPSEDVLTYSNGEYYYLGLLPGEYRVFVDPMQLGLLRAVSSPDYIEITVTNKEDGDYLDDVDFTITKRQGSSKSGDE